MATPADQRMLELLNLWLRSLELHLGYVSLDDASYAQIQAWPAHQRPSRWIIDLARKKILAVRAQLEERIETGDTTFAESLETMIFLANLVGLQHIERFIPLAEPGRDVVLQSTLEAETAQALASATATREMPNFLAGLPRAARTSPRAAATAAGKPAASAPAETGTSAGAAGSATAPAALAAPAGPATALAGPATPATPAASPRAQVLADAERLLQWGRKWYELAELIARMANRPPLPEVRRILREHKATLDQSAPRA